MAAENLMIVQGGGPTTVLNASLASVIGEGLRQPSIGNIFGARSGMKGLCSGDVVELSQLGSSELLSMRHTPGAALGSSRFKPSDEDLEAAVGDLRRLEVRHLVFMGGNGTMAGAARFSDFCRAVGFDVRVIGVPKTIDNDIVGTARCPGFASAARFVAQSTRDLAMDIRSLPQPVCIFETLGRDVGWLAAASTLGKVDEDDAPHLVCVPEVPFSQEAFLADVDSVVSRLGWAVVVVSEGTRYANGESVFEQKMGSHGGVVNRPLIGGVAQFLSGVVGENLGIRCRSEKPGLIGRSCTALISARDLEDAELVGRQGVRALVNGKTDQMVGLRSLLADEPSTCELVPFSRVAGLHRALPTEWLSHDACAVTDSFRRYALPLVGKDSLRPHLRLQ